MKKNKNPNFQCMSVFIPVFDTVKMEDFQIQQGEVWWGGGGEGQDAKIYILMYMCGCYI